MKIETTKHLKVKLKGEDADNFRSALKKIADDNKKPGFSTSKLSEDEVKVINGILDKL